MVFVTLILIKEGMRLEGAVCPCRASFAQSYILTPPHTQSYFHLRALRVITKSRSVFHQAVVNEGSRSTPNIMSDLKEDIRGKLPTMLVKIVARFKELTRALVRLGPSGACLTSPCPMGACNISIIHHQLYAP
ncbi:unnamed protein product [Discosporangium mesarthrocarpum]